MGNRLLTLLSSLLLSTAVALMHCSAVAAVEEAEARSLAELLQRLQQERTQQQAELRAREQRFLEEQAQQKARLDRARAEKRQQMKTLQPLQDELADLTAEVQQLESRLQEQGQDLRALQGAFVRIAGEVHASLQQSLVVPQRPEREAELQRLSALDALPQIEDLESLWL
ncbi:MAG: hypothetical protein ABF318_15990, partial [Ketobacter sp.]